MNDDAKRNLIQALYQLIGNKRYMKVIELMIMKIETTPAEAESIRFLAAALRQAQVEKNKKNRLGFF